MVRAAGRSGRRLAAPAFATGGLQYDAQVDYGRRCWGGLFEEIQLPRKVHFLFPCSIANAAAAELNSDADLHRGSEGNKNSD